MVSEKVRSKRLRRYDQRRERWGALLVSVSWSEEKDVKKDGGLKLNKALATTEVNHVTVM